MPLTVQPGFGKSAEQTFTIPESVDGSGIDPVDFGQSYAFFSIEIDDVGDAAGLLFTLEVGNTDSDTMTLVYDDTAIYQGALPASGGYRTMVKTAFGARRMRIILSAALGGGETVSFSLYAYDPIAP